MTSDTVNSKYDKAQELGNSCRLKIYKSSNYPEVLGVVNFLYEEMIKQYGLSKLRASSEEQLRKHMQFYVLNLYKAYTRNPAMVVAYSQDTSWYSKWNKKHRNKKDKLSYLYSVQSPPKGKPVITFLKECGYVKPFGYIHDRTDPRNRSFQSRMRARKKLIDLIEQHGVKDNMIEEDYSDEELIVLKGVNRKPKPRWTVVTPNTPQVRDLRANVEKINAVMMKSDIRVTITEEELAAINRKRAANGEKLMPMPVDFSSKRLHRVFHDRRFDRHGRFYGAWYENTHKELRPYITIDGAPTLELDYTSIHPYLCYAHAEVKPPSGGLYSLDRYSEDTRPVIKNITLKMLNASSDKAAIGAVRNWITGYRVGKKPKKKLPQIPTELGNLKSGTDLGNLMDKILDKHAPIRHYFFNSEISGILTNIDGQITEHILLYFADMGIPVLPIHDSYIIDARAYLALREYMIRVTQEGLGIYIPITNDNFPHLLVKLMEIVEQRQKENPDDQKLDEVLQAMAKLAVLEEVADIAGPNLIRKATEGAQ
jgi:hypothetical protein